MDYNEKSGRVFIAYKGTEFNKKEIYSALKEKNFAEDGIKVKYIRNVFFAKVAPQVYIEDMDPIWDDSQTVLTVNGYNQNEIKLAIDDAVRYRIDNPNEYHYITNLMYRDYGTDMFKKLGEYMHFCSVIWDKTDDTLIAGVTTPNSPHTHLYYGYTKQNHELMFSNDKTILEQFCNEIIEMPENTYMKDGELYNFDEKKTYEEKNVPLIKNSRENAESLINGLNLLLLQITDASVRAKIEQNIEDYLSSDDPKKKISDFILKELDKEVQKQILMMIKDAIESRNLEDRIDEKLEETFNEKLEEYTSKIQMPLVHIIKLNDTVLRQTSGGYYHEKFEQILTQVQLDEPIMLIGPAGSGKNVAISQVADALGLHMYYTNNASNEFKLTGFIDAGGNYRDTEFYKAFKNGGIFFLDEIDNSDPSALIVINSALANGYMAFPHETIDRHPDFRVIAAANTWGKGADLQYVGRNALDAATLDRFDNIFFDYDTNLEKNLYPNDEVLEFMWSFRNAVYQSRIPHIVSTRGIGKVYKKEINGIPVDIILTSNVVKNLGQDDVNTIIGNMGNISLYNKYYDGIKELRLER